MIVEILILLLFDMFVMINLLNVNILDLLFKGVWIINSGCGLLIDDDVLFVVFDIG